MEKILEKLTEAENNYKSILMLKEHCELNLKSQKNQMEAIKQELLILDEAVIELNKIINDKNKKYLEKVQTTINKALSFIFDDSMYEFTIEMKDKEIEFYLFDRLKGITKKLNKVGGGIRVVISVFLQMFFIETRSFRKILFCDESLYDVSEEYREKFFTFLKKYCIQNDFRIVVISHDPTIEKYIQNVLYVEPVMNTLKEGADDNANTN